MRRLSTADRRLYRLIHLHWRLPWLDPLMILVTRSGTKGTIWLVLCAALIVASEGRAARAALTAAAAMLLTQGVINLALKPGARRARPYTRHTQPRLLVAPPGPHSWPSAHSGSSMAAGMALSLAYPIWSPLFLLLAFVIGYSRIYVGVHYPADVLTGMLLGAAVASILLVTVRATGAL
jgi:undecaprenyl-diphosphatase